ncbi:hypothetical protein AAVH_00922 [Aphelenchoides avenae]|nr:hypothetical protein AAVH_00922 [Aphelenchus avenae]
MRGTSVNGHCRHSLEIGCPTWAQRYRRLYHGTRLYERHKTFISRPPDVLRYASTSEDRAKLEKEQHKLELMQQVEDNRRRKMMEKQKEWEEDERQRIRPSKYPGYGRIDVSAITFTSCGMVGKETRMVERRSRKVADSPSFEKQGEYQ